jgi:hypothetical protein
VPGEWTAGCSSPHLSPQLAKPDDPEEKSLMKTKWMQNKRTTRANRAQTKTSNTKFSSDVAYELRTPLATLHSLTEVGGRWPNGRAVVE